MEQTCSIFFQNKELQVTRFYVLQIQCDLKNNQFSPRSAPENNHSPVQGLQKAFDVCVAASPSSSPLFSSPYASVSSLSSSLGWAATKNCKAPGRKLWLDTPHCCALWKGWSRSKTSTLIPDVTLNNPVRQQQLEVWHADTILSRHTCWWSS